VKILYLTYAMQRSYNTRRYIAPNTLQQTRLRDILAQRNSSSRSVLNDLVCAVISDAETSHNAQHIHIASHFLTRFGIHASHSF
jgi:hypothetical protein